MSMIHLICIQTYHAHWAAHSGYHQFLSRLPEDIRVTHLRVPRKPVPFQDLKGAEKLWFKPAAHLAGSLANSWTTENDLLNEFRLLEQVREILVTAKDKVVIHFLDGEIGYNFFGKWRRFLGEGAECVRLVASYHQPKPLLEKVVSHPSRVRELDLVLTVGTSQFPFFDFLPRERLRFVPHGIDTEHFRPGSPRNKDVRIFCLTVGHWLRDFDALEGIVAQAPEGLIFRIVAGEEHVTRFRGRPNVELYSGVDDAEFLNLYQTSDIGLMPLEDSTANNALLEMMACGLPVVATRVGSVPDYLPETAGILIPENEADLFLAELRQLADSREERERLGEASRSRALELSWDCIAEEMAGIYRAL